MKNWQIQKWKNWVDYSQIFCICLPTHTFFFSFRLVFDQIVLISSSTAPHTKKATVLGKSHPLQYWEGWKLITIKVNIFFHQSHFTAIVNYDCEGTILSQQKSLYRIITATIAGFFANTIKNMFVFLITAKYSGVWS